MNTQLSSPSSSIGESECSVSSDTSTTISNLLVFVNQGSTCLPRKRKTGRKKFKETRHPIYHGVRNRNEGKWVCRVREPRKKTRIWLRTYLTAEVAARAYDVAALAQRGDQTTLNFPDSALVAPGAKSTLARDIRLAGHKATRVDHCSSSKANGGRKSEEKVETCSTSNVFEKSNVENNPRGMVLDEEEVFNMPVLINSMAEGMLLTPPALKKGVNWDQIYGNDSNSSLHLDLW